MIYFYYGDDTFTLAREIKKLRSASPFVEELSIGDLSDAQLKSRLIEILQSQGLFAARKLVILKNFLTNIADYEQAGDYLLKFIETSPSSPPHEEGLGEVIVIFEQTEKFDKRLKFFKALSKLAKTREFNIPAGAELAAWVRDYLGNLGYQIEAAALKEFVGLMGAEEDERLYDLWQVAAELEKLMLLKSEAKVITAGAVRETVKPNASQNIFRITNMFAEGRAAEAIKFLEQIIEPPQMIIGGLASQLRSLLLVKSLEQESSAKIAARLGWKEGRVWINAKLAKRFSKEKLIKLLSDLKALDLRLKTSEEPPKLLLALFIQKARI